MVAGGWASIDGGFEPGAHSLLWETILALVAKVDLIAGMVALFETLFATDPLDEVAFLW